MRRHDALIPLTHDHHHALARARRLRLAAASENGEEQRAAAEEFVEFFEGDSVLHFREEEEILFPLVIGERPPSRRCTRSASSSPRTSARRSRNSSP